eukprot:4902255-Prymnesium_polylepis.1
MLPLLPARGSSEGREGSCAATAREDGELLSPATGDCCASARASSSRQLWRAQAAAAPCVASARPTSSSTSLTSESSEGAVMRASLLGAVLFLLSVGGTWVGPR